jgi:hypothetical protein
MGVLLERGLTRQNLTGTDMSAAPTIVLLAGAGTFGNEWLQTGKPNWRVVPATLLASWGFSLLDQVSEKASVSLAIIVAIAAVTTKFGGVSIVTELNRTLNGTSKITTGKAS